jgi:hypothetical protein
MSRHPFDLRVTEELRRMVEDAFPSQMMRPRAEQRVAALRQRRVPRRVAVVVSGVAAAIALAVVGVNVLGRNTQTSTQVAVQPPQPQIPPGTDQGPTVPPDAQGSSAITGAVTVGGRPLKGADVRVAIEPCCLYREAFTGEDGRYSITGLPAGGYHVSFTKGARISWYRDKLNFGESDVVTVDDGQQLSGVDGVLIAGSTISGRVANQRGAPIVGLWVYFDGPSYGKVETDAGGKYAINDLPPGDYTVRFDPGPANLPYTGQYYNDKPQTSQADRIHLDDGGQRTGVDAVLAGG